METSVSPETRSAKQGTNHQEYQGMEFTSASHTDQKSYPDGLEIRSDKYPQTVYILRLLPRQHELVVYHMARQTTKPADPLSASVVLFEQYNAAVGEASLSLPWLLKSLKNINVASDQGSKVMLVIGTENQKLVAPSKQTLVHQKEFLNHLCTQVNEITASGGKRSQSLSTSSKRKRNPSATV